MTTNGHADTDAGANVLTDEQAAVIVMLMHRIGIDADSSSMLEAQVRKGGPATPHGYLLMTTMQADALIGLMVRYLEHLEASREGEKARSRVEAEMSA